MTQKRRLSGATLTELVVVIVVVGILASAFVSLFSPLTILFFYVPQQLRTEQAGWDIAHTLLSGDPTVRGFRYTEPPLNPPIIWPSSSPPLDGYIVPPDPEEPPSVGQLAPESSWGYFTNIIEAGDNFLSYSYTDGQRQYHTATIQYNTMPVPLIAPYPHIERSVDAGPIEYLPLSGSLLQMNLLDDFPAMGPPGGNNSFFRYYAANGARIAPNVNAARVETAFSVNIGGQGLGSGVPRARAVVRSGTWVRKFFHANPADWDFEMIFRDGDDLPDLLGVQKSLTASDKMEVTIWSGASDYISSIFNSTILWGTVDQSPDYFDFEVGDYDTAVDGVKDLWGLKKRTFSRPGATYDWNCALHIFNGANSFQGHLRFNNRGNPINIQPPVNENWEFEAAQWDGLGQTDLVAVEKSGRGDGLMRIIILDGRKLVNQPVDYWLQIMNSPLSNMPGCAKPEDCTIEFADWNDNSPAELPGENETPDRPDLIVIRKRGTVSGGTEVHVLSGNGLSPFGGDPLHLATPWTATNNEDEFEAVRYLYLTTDNHVDIARIHKANTSSNKVEVEVLDGVVTSLVTGNPGEPSTGTLSTFLLPRTVSGAPAVNPGEEAL